MSQSNKPQYSALAAKAAEEVSSKWKGTTADGGRTKNYIGGEFVESQAEKWLEVNDPVSWPPIVWFMTMRGRRPSFLANLIIGSSPRDQYPT